MGTEALTVMGGIPGNDNEVKTGAEESYGGWLNATCLEMFAGEGASPMVTFELEEFSGGWVKLDIIGM